MKELIFATGNPNKVREVQALLGQSIAVKSLAELGYQDELPENQDTLEGNALEKARFVANRFGQDCFSEDTGLEIDCMDGRPGVYSARYAGADKDADDTMDKVLAEMQNCTKRTARFRTVFALIINGEHHLFEGTVEGKIAEEKRGAGGFGYDPIFQPDGYQQTFGELPISVKRMISHRARAFQKLKTFLDRM